MARSAPKPWQEGEAVGSFGHWLRQQREIRNISLREIADSTKIGIRYLEALEEDRFEVLPAPIFAKGFLREYARYVGLDADEVVNFYLVADRDRRGDDAEEEEPLFADAVVSEEASPGGPISPRVLAIGVAAVVLLLVLALGVWWWTSRETEGGAQESASPPPIAAPVAETPAPAEEPAAAAEASSAPLVVTVGFTAECWVEAVVDGEERISELRVQGESMRLEAQESVRFVTIGNASAVRIEVNGEPYRLAGDPGQVVRDLVISVADLEGAVAAPEADAAAEPANA